MSGRLSAADRQRVRAAVEVAIAGVDRVNVGDVIRRVRDDTGFDYSGPTLAPLLKSLGFARARQGIYARQGRAA